MKTEFHSKIKKHSKHSENVSIESLVICANQAKVIITGMEIKYWLSNVSSFNVYTQILSSNSLLLTMTNSHTYVIRIKNIPVLIATLVMKSVIKYGQNFGWSSEKQDTIRKQSQVD